VAFEVVWQGIRIRLGRSVVTLLGVVLGIAFLMAILTGQMIRRGVSAEAAARAELRRMTSFLTAETGPLKGRRLGVAVCGPLSAMEVRFLEGLGRAGLAGIAWTGDGRALAAVRLPAGCAVRRADHGAVARDAAGVLAIGDGPLAGLAEGAGGRTPLAVTRQRHALAPPAGVSPVLLEREWQSDELAQAAREARRARFRTLWIAGISLLVTVIGISNAMLMSVTERFREIGTMKCLGAMSGFIRQVFFVESSLMGLCGSAGGCLLGLALAAGGYALSYGPRLVLGALDPPTLLFFAAGSVAAGVALSVLAAIYPAGVAARMVPAAALRSTV
jgi:hypothetical protein